MDLILGIDDAGRGPVIGPMILAGCLMDKKYDSELRKLGVRDSKDLTELRREFLEKEIRERAETFEIVKISPNEIERKNLQGTKLNEVEAEMAAKIINKINDGEKKITVIVDCPSTTISKWKDYLKTKIENLSNLDIVCEHKADRKYVPVSAASIIAKCERERQMDLLKKKYGEEIGSGYPSDPKTTKFLEKYFEKYENEGIFRKTWETWKKLKKQTAQKKLKF
jgi:ribonuclease HII